MRNTINFLFPAELQMAILQLEGYDYLRFLAWISKNFFVRTKNFKKGLVLTKKVIVLYILSSAWMLGIMIVTLKVFPNPLLDVVVFLILLSQPYLLYGLSLAVLYPFEQFVRERIKDRTSSKLNSIKNLLVIGITGSYGKSLTKEILYQILKDKFPTIRTPKSYNTLLGISKVINLEVDSSYKYFICEIAAYRRGEIKELCEVIEPKIGIITGITGQHLERFGSLENIIKAKFELVDALKKGDLVVFNLDDRNVLKELEKRKINNPYGYGLENPKAFVRARSISFSEKGSRFILIIGNKKYRVSSSLFGYGNVQNILAAVALSLKIGLKSEYLAGKIANLKPVSNRFSLSKIGNSTIIDDTYSSNDQGFREAIRTVATLKESKVLVTPGIVELGKEEKPTHENLGRLASGVFDKIVLVGKNGRTNSLAKGINKKSKIQFIPDERKHYFETINNLTKTYKWILLENDVTENY